mmetsp:Transcript_15464/g.18757  ORF Transcript_15464/g.18757 Transcript_15464/m.18757 type:complete len:225 (+) Transcript_15464:145-819(+)|eukprot:CAMPEP_0184008664 /NCGR_PEP_ID=MMETSP0954-20121128/2112_1 /TAXON_ID=627963 /ORGANISM="Aplanochytrium sp, Strain PBS07" /LENGTH=224 /DNA_ID=CAMNT_0026287825 /DNA_START=143 /DNA_END=817 /DNA_ORIENTATION=+
MASATDVDLSVIDALPYVDSLIDESPSARAQAELLLRNEMKQFDPSNEYRKILGTTYEPDFRGSKILQNTYADFVKEYEKTGNRPARPSFTGLIQGIPDLPETDTSLEELVATIDKLKQSIEYHNNSLVNAELAKKFRPSAVRAHAAAQEAMQANAKRECGLLETSLTKIHKERKASQLKAEVELRRLKEELDAKKDRERRRLLLAKRQAMENSSVTAKKQRVE